MTTYGRTDKPLVLAHRGGAGEASENTLAAFQNAVKQGCTYLETDVMVGEDGVLYLHHGSLSLHPNRPLTNNVTEKLANLSKLFIKYPDLYFAIDPKHKPAIKPLVELIIKHDMIDQVCIGASFDSRAEMVADLVEKASGTRPATALVGVASLVKLIAKSINMPLTRPGTQPRFIHVPSRLITKRIVQVAHAWDMKIIAWVLNDKKSIEKALELGVDGFMTDYPKAAQKVVVHQS
jgi:glycerophosphoryl diester phosphodiesterase